MRTVSEILAYDDDNDFFGFAREALVGFLTFNEARPWLKPDATGERWSCHPRERDAVLAVMRDYMAFAWEKVIDHRGLSAGRSVTKFRAWAWFLGDDDLVRDIDETEYAPYGAPILALICARLGFPIPDDETAKRMAAGEACSRGCSGCGS